MQMLGMGGKVARHGRNMLCSSSKWSQQCDKYSREVHTGTVGEDGIAGVMMIGGERGI